MPFALFFPETMLSKTCQNSPTELSFSASFAPRLVVLFSMMMLSRSFSIILILSGMLNLFFFFNPFAERSLGRPQSLSDAITSGDILCNSLGDALRPGSIFIAHYDKL